jgi:hypothetical protein
MRAIARVAELLHGKHVTAASAVFDPCAFREFGGVRMGNPRAPISAAREPQLGWREEKCAGRLAISFAPKQRIAFARL